ncbi:DUF4238 domain-containing protein [Tateyamaria armeniaca]|uniref:DUF4238 domain-containing protein n=1 Tax=Tateyamaria armeniaca TaxID=2518930 RepID=A0ABW8USC6_9RHOB
MALDHFVSQVHLKQFLRTTNPKLLNAVRKTDLAQFTPRPQDVCRVEDGSTNAFLTDNRIIEKFLRDIEPAYEPCLSRIIAGELDWQSRWVFAGFLAYLQTYTPTALRMFEPMIRTLLEQTARSLETSGELEPISIPSLPDWDGKTFSELAQEGKVKFDINLRMPQAMATTQLLQIQNSLASSDVTILRCKGRMRFLTSDFPSIILGHHQNIFAQRFLPLSPSIGLIFHTNTSSKDRHEFPYRFIDVGDRRVDLINNLIIQSAENLVFATYRHPWLLSKVSQFKNYRVENVVENSGPLIRSQQRVVSS